MQVKLPQWGREIPAKSYKSRTGPQGAPSPLNRNLERTCRVPEIQVDVRWQKRLLATTCAIYSFFEVQQQSTVVKLGLNIRGPYVWVRFVFTFQNHQKRQNGCARASRTEPRELAEQEPNCPHRQKQAEPNRI